MIELIDDPGRFDAAAGGLLAARVDGTILATVLHGIHGGRYIDVTPRLAVVRDVDGSIIAAALRTPPWPMVCCGEIASDDARDLIDAWLADDPEVPGINATPQIASAVGDAWATHTGGTHRLQTAMALHALDAVTDPPHPTAGSLRAAGPGDEPIVLAWFRAFAAEAHVREDSEQATRSARAVLAGERVYLWEDAGEVVSMLGHTVAIDGVPRIGPVYTPPERRGRGYAGHAVAQLSRRLLGAGARRCVLFSDLANPTSNKIYAEVGYARISDWEVRDFVPAAQAGVESPIG